MLTLSPDGRELDDLVPQEAGRLLLGITGAPGAGKSTLAAALARSYGATVVPMDGFHLADAELARLGLLDRKGAPDTFDAEGYAALLARVRGREDGVRAPMFEHRLGHAVTDTFPVPPTAGLVVTEGNYLLLDEARWRAVRDQLDVVWHVVTDQALRLERLVARHVATGRTPAKAVAWVEQVDEPNAVRVEASAPRADLLLDLTAWSRARPRTSPVSDR